MLRPVIKSMRPHQWYKNFVIFLCIIFSKNILNLEMWLDLLLIFFVFCMLAGSQYMLNDLKDIEKDRLHPKKRNRPIAAGLLPVKNALFISFTIMAVSLAIAFSMGQLVGIVSLLYLVNSIVYSFYFKNFAIVDAIFIAVGFVIRAIVGCVVINVIISPWLILCVFLLALVLTFGKRRHELDGDQNSRNSLSQYNITMSETLLNSSVSMLLMSYALYTVSVHTAMMLTLPFAFYGVFRYVQLINLKGIGEEVELLMKDKPFVLNIMLWVFLTVLVLYGGP
ncbi:decaprenyl-phosphate phosphoribosyltransferase [uncultured Methanomethylovorans sp.]|uniref:decaprenyl-phosphate phosphoribosyltransferase n=1 Tax=uncultured Methanomethylovorans sp. TaxID=183759 RepID=UPI002608759E|nr:decaprenyl-phosphate phosphoribosyltransferase [uncultured Methanomethylovorans sp.]